MRDVAVEQLHSDLWIADAPQRFLGLEIGARMTVVRLPDQRLLLHSPIAATPDRVREVEALGPVAYLVAPNRLHHLYIAEWQRACPNAQVYAAPGLETKRPDLANAGVLGDEPEPGWQEVLDQVFLAGFSFANEVVFFHRPSATLIASDLAFNIGPTSRPLTRFVFRMGRAYGQLVPTILERLLVEDRTAFRHGLERILDWPFERVVVAHGSVSTEGGRDQLVRGYGWVLDSE